MSKLQTFFLVLALLALAIFSKQCRAQSLPAGVANRYATATAEQIVFEVTPQGGNSNFFVWLESDGYYLHFAEAGFYVYSGGGQIYQNFSLVSQPGQTYTVMVSADSVFRNGFFVYELPSGHSNQWRVGTYSAAAEFNFIQPEVWQYPAGMGWPVTDTEPTPAAIDTLTGRILVGEWEHPAPEPFMVFALRWIGQDTTLYESTTAYQSQQVELAEGQWMLAVAAVDSVNNTSAEAFKTFYLQYPEQPVEPDTTAPSPVINIKINGVDISQSIKGLNIFFDADTSKVKISQ